MYTESVFFFFFFVVVVVVVAVSCTCICTGCLKNVDLFEIAVTPLFIVETLQYFIRL